MSGICLLCKKNKSTSGKEHYVNIYKKTWEKDDIDVYDLKNIQIPLCLSCFKTDKKYSHISLLISFWVITLIWRILNYYYPWLWIVLIVIISSILRIFIYFLTRNFFPGNISEELDESRDKLKSDGRKTGTPPRKKNDKLNEIIDHRETKKATGVPLIFEILIALGFFWFCGFVIILIWWPMRYKFNPYYDYQRVNYYNYSFVIPQNRYKPLDIDSNIQNVFQFNPELKYIIDNTTNNMISIQTKKSSIWDFKTISELWNENKTKQMFLDILQWDDEFSKCSSWEIKSFSWNEYLYYNCLMFNNDNIHLYITSIAWEIHIISFYRSEQWTRLEADLLTSRFNSIRGKKWWIDLINEIESKFLRSFTTFNQLFNN